MPIHYRFAELSNSTMVLNWRNEESVRRSSRDQALIPNHVHELWFATRVSNFPREPILIFSSANIDIGFTRLDLLDATKGILEVSIVVVADMRDRGFGSLMLERTIEVARNLSGIGEINATVRDDNLTSLKLFIASGFNVVETDAGFVKLRFSLLK